jgi:hypothetical protein
MALIVARSAQLNGYHWANTTYQNIKKFTLSQKMNESYSIRNILNQSLKSIQKMENYLSAKINFGVA